MDTQTHECGLPADRHSRPFNILRKKQTTRTTARDNERYERGRRKVGDNRQKEGKNRNKSSVKADTHTSVHGSDWPGAERSSPIRNPPTLKSTHTHTHTEEPPVLTSYLILFPQGLLQLSCRVNHDRSWKIQETFFQTVILLPE